MKLYPPVIEGVLPAFCGSAIQIPFTMNKSVNEFEVAKFALKIKTVQNQNVLYQEAIISELVNWNKEASIIKFDIPEGLKVKLNVGQFYKLQLAYINTNEEVGYYSTIGVAKYTAEPQLSLESKDGQTYVGTYSQKQTNPNKIVDVTEKVYSYCFTLIDTNGKVVETTGEQLHNHSLDIESDESNNTYVIKFDLEKNKLYTLEYKIITNNNLISYIKKTIMRSGSINPTLNASVICDVNKEEGYIDVNLKIRTAAVGQYYLLRASDEDDFKSWNEVFNFELQKHSATKNLWKDMTIKQGVKYKYAVQQYNDYGLRSNRLESDIIQADFEYSFLYDGKRQLKIKYNPKISSFKTTLMETKVDTIGNKYPFIFKNGNIGYKEFPISGLISFLSDENKMFINQDSYDNNYEFKTNLTTNNICSEREFKIEVLDWLNNGEPKLFKSPTEGNYIVRLLNVSLTPIDQLGRMLHTFNCTAYEIADNNYNNLEKFNFISVNIPFQNQIYVLSRENFSPNLNEDLLEGRQAASISFENMFPGDVIVFDLKDSDGNMTPNQTIYIGSTGRYNISMDNNVIIYNLRFIKSAGSSQRLLTYNYYVSKFKDKFDVINSMQTVSVPCRQFIGPFDEPDNLIYEINTVKDTLESISFMKFYLRDTTKLVYKYNNKYYLDEGLSEEIIIGNSINIYKIKEKRGTVWIETNNYLDGYYTDKEGNPRVYTENNYAHRYRSRVYINKDGSRPIDLAQIDGGIYYQDKGLESIKFISIGAGVIAEIGYQKKIVNYDIENWVSQETKDNLQNTEEELYRIIGSDNSLTQVELKQLYDNRNNKYKLFCEELQAAITKAEKGDNV